MTNREKLIKTNIYDLLIEWNKAVMGFECDCIMAAVTGGEITYSWECGGKCRECISKWLNEEAK